MPRRLTYAGAVVAAVLSIAAADFELDFDAVPWPADVAPTTADVDAQLLDAQTRLARDLDRQYAEAIDPELRGADLVVDQADIDAGVWSTPELYDVGAAWMAHRFSRAQGLGASDGRLHRVETAELGGPEAHACADCHAGGGYDGAGPGPRNAFLLADGDAPASGLIRNPPPLIGLGLVQALAAEMTADLAGQRQQALDRATSTARPVSMALTSKGVDFGTLRVEGDGTVITDDVFGVSADLVVRPFGWRGSFASLRRAVEDEARLHLGIQSHVLALAHRDDPMPERLGSGPDWFDPDADGVDEELTEGTLTAVSVYLALREAPTVVLPADPGLRDRWANGSRLFDALACAECHRRSLPLASTTWLEAPDTTDGAAHSIDLLAEGDHPKGSPQVALFSDLRRHDMGDALAEPIALRGLRPAQFLTRPLWGLAESAPYLHDGRAATIPAAIEAHGGEAQASADAFAGLTESERADVLVFLLSLSRAPKIRGQG